MENTSSQANNYYQPTRLKVPEFEECIKDMALNSHMGIMAVVQLLIHKGIISDKEFDETTRTIYKQVVRPMLESQIKDINEKLATGAYTLTSTGVHPTTDLDTNKGENNGS